MNSERRNSFPKRTASTLISFSPNSSSQTLVSQGQNLIRTLALVFPLLADLSPHRRFVPLSLFERIVSDASKKKATQKKGTQKKAAAAAKRGGKSAAAATSSKAAVEASIGVEKVSDGIGLLHISDRTCTGVLCSHPQSRYRWINAGHASSEYGRYGNPTTENEMITLQKEQEGLDEAKRLSEKEICMKVLGKRLACVFSFKSTNRAEELEAENEKLTSELQEMKATTASVKDMQKMINQLQDFQKRIESVSSSTPTDASID